MLDQSFRLCSRREAERWIEAGRVSLNGKELDTPAVTVTPGDMVTVDGKPMPLAGPGLVLEPPVTHNPLLLHQFDRVVN